MPVKVRRVQQKKPRAIHNDRALLFTPGPPRKSNDEYAAEQEGSLTAFYGNDAIKALVSSSVGNIERASRLIVSPLTADHRRWQIEVVTAKVLRHDGMIMTRGKTVKCGYRIVLSRFRLKMVSLEEVSREGTKHGRRCYLSRYCQINVILLLVV
jgi:hypothetical protein